MCTLCEVQLASRYSRVKIRDAKAEDARAAAQVLRRSISDLCVADHGNDPVILAQWLSNKAPDIVALRMTAPNKLGSRRCRFERKPSAPCRHRSTAADKFSSERLSALTGVGVGGASSLSMTAVVMVSCGYGAGGRRRELARTPTGLRTVIYTR